MVIQFCQRFQNSSYKNPGEALIKYIRDVFLPYSEDDNDEQANQRGHGAEWCLDLSYEGIKSIFSQYGDIYSGSKLSFNLEI